MSKELPYFKFYVNEWMAGDITLEDFETQGLFTNLCAYYWSKECDITLSNAKRKFKECKPNAFDSLISAKIIKVGANDALIINFLLEQFDSRGIVSRKNSDNGKLGGRPIGSTKNRFAKEPLKPYVPEPTGTHIEFSKKILSDEGELDREAIEVSCKKKITPEIIKLFNANCVNQSKIHSTYKDWKGHLSNWYSVRKEVVSEKRNIKKL